MAMTEIERLIDMLSCGNSMPQERIRWARSLVDLARAEGAAEELKRIRALAVPLNRVYELGEGEGRILLASTLASGVRP